MKKNKTLYRILILIGFILINIGILFGISQVIVYLNTGADRSKMLHLDNNRERHYFPEVKWESLDNPGRPLEEANKLKIEQGYLDAWHAKNNAFFTGNSTGIFDHYTANARKKITDLLALNKTQNTYIEATTLSHHISLEFYSADGTIAVLTDKNVSGVERVFKDEQFVYERTFNDDYKVILLLENGFWRIRHFEKTATTPLKLPESSVKLNTTLLEGINYYPQNTPWDTFGNDFNPSLIAQDFTILKDLSLNSIRVFVPYDDFGKAVVLQSKLKKLETLLDIAQKEDLKVIITLFDFYGDYHMQDWTHTNAHIKAIASRLKNHPALLAWGLKNEPDLDFDSRGKQEVLSWLEQSIRYLKKIDSQHPITIGWSSPETALLLEEEVDMVSYHYYKDLNNLSDTHKKLIQATLKPVVLQEFGMSSYHGIWNPFGNSEKNQADYYTRFFETQKRDSIHYLSWTLFDFEEIPNRVAGDLPWRKKKQAYFGIINKLGLKDDTYRVIKNR